jgi:hypothetical protein
MRDVSRYFIHVCQVVRGGAGAYGTGTDVYGEPLVTGGTPVALTLNCRVEWDRRRMPTGGGEEVICSGVIYLPATYVDIAGVTQTLDIGPQDRIIFEGREHAVALRVRAEGWTLDSGRHWEVWFV